MTPAGASTPPAGLTHQRRNTHHVDTIAADVLARAGLRPFPALRPGVGLALRHAAACPARSLRNLARAPGAAARRQAPAPRADGGGPVARRRHRRGQPARLRQLGGDHHLPRRREPVRPAARRRAEPRPAGRLPARDRLGHPGLRALDGRLRLPGTVHARHLDSPRLPARARGRDPLLLLLRDLRVADRHIGHLHRHVHPVRRGPRGDRRRPDVHGARALPGRALQGRPGQSRHLRERHVRHDLRQRGRQRLGHRRLHDPAHAQTGLRPGLRRRGRGHGLDRRRHHPAGHGHLGLHHGRVPGDVLPERHRLRRHPLRPLLHRHHRRGALRGPQAGPAAGAESRDPERPLRLHLGKDRPAVPADRDPARAALQRVHPGVVRVLRERRGGAAVPLRGPLARTRAAAGAGGGRGDRRRRGRGRQDRADPGLRRHVHQPARDDRGGAQGERGHRRDGRREPDRIPAGGGRRAPDPRRPAAGHGHLHPLGRADRARPSSRSRSTWSRPTCSCSTGPPSPR